MRGQENVLFRANPAEKQPEDTVKTVAESPSKYSPNASLDHFEILPHARTCYTKFPIATRDSTDSTPLAMVCSSRLVDVGSLVLWYSTIRTNKTVEVRRGR